MLLNRIKPQRFVYHVSKRENRKSIDQQGLRTNTDNGILNFQNAVFANNSNCGDWFPFVIDVFEECNFNDYDIWRIDTNKINNEWFIDNRCLGANWGDAHILSHKAIPRFALDLFILEDFRICFSEMDGASHYHTLGGFTINKLKKIKL